MAPRKSYDMLKWDFREEFRQSCLRLVRARIRKTDEFGNPPLNEKQDYQAEFIRALDRRTPEVRQALMEKVAPLHSLDPFKPGDKYLLARNAWATEFNIAEPWILGWADSLSINRDAAISGTFLGAIPGSVDSGSSCKTIPLEFDNLAWNPALDGPEFAVGAICNVISEKLCQYVEQQVISAEEAGITFLPEQRERATSPEQRMEWLALRVVRKWKKARIVKEYRLGNKSNPKNAEREVGRETNRLAQIICIKPPYQIRTIWPTDA